MLEKITNTIADDILENIAGETGEKLDPGTIERFLQSLPDKALSLGVRIAFAILFFIVGVELIKLIRKILKKSLQRASADKGAIQFLDSFVKAALYVLLVFMIGTSFGLDAASIVALLGSAGVAIGLAVQGSLSNLAGGILILLLKPFKVGDYIIEDSKGNEGTVSEIQVFYTKLITPDEKVIVLPNGTLANTSLTNVTATYKRRLDLTVGISYQSDLAKAKEILTRLLAEDEAPIKNLDMLVFVDQLGESAVILGIRCYVENDDYWPARWRLLEGIKLQFDANGIGIPFPQMEVHLGKGDGG